MNQQPLYYGQLVIGPAGSGKVLYTKKYLKKIMKSSQHIVK